MNILPCQLQELHCFGCIKKVPLAVNTGDAEHFQSHEGSHYDDILSLWKNMYVPVQREVMFIFDRFVEETPPGKYPWTKEFFCLSFLFSPLDQITNINIFHMVAKE